MALFTFAGGSIGLWRIPSTIAVRGDRLPSAHALTVIDGDASAASEVAWSLRGITSNQRYTTRAEHDGLAARPADLGRPEASHAALIPIRKTAAWWLLTQDERRTIFEERTQHIATSLPYTPAIARRLHHSRDLGEPFDFLTWFEFAPADAPAFDEFVARLRASEEWRYVDREVEVRLTRG